MFVGGGTICDYGGPIIAETDGPGDCLSWGTIYFVTCPQLFAGLAKLTATMPHVIQFNQTMPL